MQNISLILRFLCLYNIVKLTEANHLKVRHVCEDQHIDITQASGVGIESEGSSTVTLSGIKFPLNTFTEGDKLSFQFKTSSRDGLLFHAQSHHLKHELTAWIENGEVRLRISGHCHWLYLRDVAHDDRYNVSDNNFHTLVILAKSTGISFTIDQRNEKSFLYASNPMFRCWHVEKFYFGHTSPDQTLGTPPVQFTQKITGCLRYFTSDKTNNTDIELVTSYRRVSSCENLS